MSVEARLEALEKRFQDDAADRVQRQHDFDKKFEEMLKSINDKFSKLSYTIFGNGKIEGSLCWSIREINMRLDGLEKRVNDFFRTDNWRKDFFAGALRSVATAVLAAIMLKYIIK